MHGYSDGPFCPIHIARTRDGLRTYAPRNLQVQPAGSLVNTIVHADDNAHFTRIFVDTTLIRTENTCT